jgi:hypothetical protein
MKFLTTIFILLAFPAIALAGPFLVCDPPDPAEQVTSYTIYKDGEVFAENVPAPMNYDLNGLAPGQYTWTATAHNVWGASEPSNPYISPSGASSPTNLQMEE